jgi:hypothetical protein
MDTLRWADGIPDRRVPDLALLVLASAETGLATVVLAVAGRRSIDASLPASAGRPTSAHNFRLTSLR